MDNYQFLNTLVLFLKLKFNCSNVTLNNSRFNQNESIQKISYIQISSGRQTYIYSVERKYIRFKLLVIKDELETANAQCKQAGWQIVSATNLVKKLNSISRKY